MSCYVGVLDVLRNMLFLNIYPCYVQHINAWNKTKKRLNTYMVLKFNVNKKFQLNNLGWLKYVDVKII
jgi:hypothetical protein